MVLFFAEMVFFKLVISALYCTSASLHFFKSSASVELLLFELLFLSTLIKLSTLYVNTEFLVFKRPTFAANAFISAFNISFSSSHFLIFKISASLFVEFCLHFSKSAVLAINNWFNSSALFFAISASASALALSASAFLITSAFVSLVLLDLHFSNSAVLAINNWFNSSALFFAISASASALALSASAFLITSAFVSLVLLDLHFSNSAVLAINNWFNSSALFFAISASASALALSASAFLITSAFVSVVLLDLHFSNSAVLAINNRFNSSALFFAISASASALALSASAFLIISALAMAALLQSSSALFDLLSSLYKLSTLYVKL